MRSALTSTAALVRPSMSSLLMTPRTSAFLPSIRFSSTAAAADATSSTSTTPRPYVIGLTAGNQYPVYARTKAAGSSKFTIVKKIEGNKKAFAQDLAREAGFPSEEVKLNPVTGHVQVKGFHVDKVKEWLNNTLGNSAAAKSSTTATTA
ncbi:54S ribosomal protein img2, mitochondrial [Colletotrichum spaethianum]|uniref:Large ribosomal subunit protein mL49 n=1 Tax=Colletotrichum spaethianum TaxID=700344 RepID=A0AA37PE72_9PEZI|nr:54S ribosomal protein img2, mitochondrial [Colletotrichum spaethianum]GKT50636.1 54S ribosomal protein img2, mitochondrial [Colletotrichum spaethianum]